MFFELIATFVAGFAGAGVALLLNKLVGGRLPRWIIPIAAGAAMLATTIANEYGWYGRTVGSLPSGLEVATTVENAAIYRPWAYVIPFVSRFLAVDTATMRTNDALPGQKMVEVYAFGRWAAPQSRLVMVDCDGGRRADVPPGTEVSPSGRVEGLDWRDTGADDPIVATSCRAH
jgi:hypothetical protein